MPAPSGDGAAPKRAATEAGARTSKRSGELPSPRIGPGQAEAESLRAAPCPGRSGHRADGCRREPGVLGASARRANPLKPARPATPQTCDSEPQRFTRPSRHRDWLSGISLAEVRAPIGLFQVFFAKIVWNSRRRQPGPASRTSAGPFYSANHA